MGGGHAMDVAVLLGFRVLVYALVGLEQARGSNDQLCCLQG